MPLENFISCPKTKPEETLRGKQNKWDNGYADKVSEGTLQPRLYADPQYVFSLFGRGYFSKKSNKWVPACKPQQVFDIPRTGAYIKSDRAKWATETLRSMLASANEQELRDFKAKEFDAIAVAGNFSYRNANSLLTRSRYIVLDIDDLSSTEEAREVQRTLAADQQVETALCFVSPKGLGVKWIAELPKWCQELPFPEQYASLSRYVGFEYGIQADPSCSDVCRLCYLPYDPECFINQKYLSL